VPEPGGSLSFFPLCFCLSLPRSSSGISQDRTQYSASTVVKECSFYQFGMGQENREAVRPFLNSLFFLKKFLFSSPGDESHMRFVPITADARRPARGEGHR